MTIAPRTPAKLAFVLTAVVLPVAGAHADSGTGGAAYGSQTDGTKSPAGAKTPAEVGTRALHARPNALLGRTLHLRGAAGTGRRVIVQRFDARAAAWRTAATARSSRHGRFVALWHTDHIGVIKLRALTAGAAGASASAATPAIRVTVFKPAIATFYGPGFYGKRTACGMTMSHTLIGVAHRGLPCGREVALYYRGRTIVAPVVDRGPFGTKASWDLTSGAAEALGFSTTDRIGAVSVRPAPAGR